MVILLFYWLKIKFFIDILCDENDDISADETGIGTADETDIDTAEDTDICIKKQLVSFKKLKIIGMNITIAYVYCFIHIDVLGRKNAINKYLEKIKCSVASIEDPNTLDRILALMMKANASTAISDINPQSKFEKKTTSLRDRRMKYSFNSQRHLKILEGNRRIYH